MRLIRQFCLLLALPLVAAGCKKKEPQSPQQVSSERVEAALLLAAEYGNIDQVRLLISKGAPFKTHALHVAADYGQKDVAELLIAKGANIDAKGYENRTPLHTAVGSGHKDVAELLIANGADVNAKDERGQTPLHFAAMFPKQDLTRLLS